MPNGTYLAVAYAWSAQGSELGRLFIEGMTEDLFRAGSFNGYGPWAPLGPYEVTVTDGSLTVAGTGGLLRLGGLELSYLGSP